MQLEGGVFSAAVDELRFEGAMLPFQLSADGVYDPLFPRKVLGAILAK